LAFDWTRFDQTRPPVQWFHRPDLRPDEKGEKLMMNNVLALAELGADMGEQGFLGVISGNSGNSNNCGSSSSEGC